MDRRRQLDLFLDETSTHVEALERIVGSTSGSPSPASVDDALLLHAHAVKGLAATLGFPELARDAHRFESAVRDRPPAAGPDAVAVALETLGRRLREIERGVVCGARNERPSVRVPVSTLLDLRNRVRSRLVGSIGDSPDAAARAACREVLGELDEAVDAVLSARVDDLAPTLRDAARSAAGSTGKSIDLVVDDQAGPVPRTVLESLLSALVQLVRNAAVHGIEDATERGARDKDPVGTVAVRARRCGDRLVLAVEDDGRGVRGLGTGTVADDVLEATVLRDGHTTARAVGPGAGRGVGLGIVRDAVRHAGGRLALRNDPGRGAAWTVVVPVGSPRG